uniref:TIGR00297 family protein n=1 Tax=Octactis speculum TaxID=3111310 RepID=A0A7S2GNY6_9STRA|mmetsp:Transcript_52404/g.71545  ORF Transcript_52404/g.71545 Transcript_52404/m.71545 type:complete len:290 (+) Transcript_52404:13-882(+)
MKSFSTLIIASILVAGNCFAPRRISLMKKAKLVPSRALNLPVADLLLSEPGKAVALNTGLAIMGSATGQKMLTPSGLLHAWALGIILWSALGWQGWSLCVFYLVMGSVVTKVKIEEKSKLGIAEGRGGSRGPENVWGSAATGALCAAAMLKWPQYRSLLQVGYVSSIATKLSDTFASEIGKAYGKRCFLITTLKPVPRGTEGAVSLEGTLAGVVGSLIIAIYGAAVGLVSWQSITVTMIAAFVATTAESLIGATAQGKFKILTNEVVNFINTLIGAFVGISLTALKIAV